MTTTLEEKIAALELENARLAEQNRNLRGDFDRMRAYFHEKPATLEVLAALDRECRRVNDALLRDRKMAIEMLARIGGMPEAPTQEKTLTDCGVNPMIVVCAFANGGDCLYPSNKEGCQHGRTSRQAIGHGLNEVICQGNSAYAYAG